jgi:hypothetical protein
MSDQARMGWLVAVQGRYDTQPRLYAVGGALEKYRSLKDEIAEALARVGDYLSITNERDRFERHLTDGEIARLKLKPGQVKRFS